MAKELSESLNEELGKLYCKEMGVTPDKNSAYAC
jgi:hypothetical protein